MNRKMTAILLAAAVALTLCGVSVFAAEKDKRRHEKRFCVSMLGYPDCPVYRALALKYRNEA